MTVLFICGLLAFFDFNGASNFTDTFNDEDDDFTSLTVSAGSSERGHMYRKISAKLIFFSRSEVTERPPRPQCEVRVFPSRFQPAVAHRANVRVLSLRLGIRRDS